MDKTHGIIIFGANGSGKTTLGRELAGLLGFRHMDIEDYYFEKSEIPYTVKRSRKDCLELMLSDIEKYGSFVITAVTGDFGDEIQRLYELAVGITAPHEVRMSRIKQRSRENTGIASARAVICMNRNSSFLILPPHVPCQGSGNGRKLLPVRLCMWTGRRIGI